LIKYGILSSEPTYMLSLEVVAVFFATSALLCVAPGPDNIFVLTQSAVHGPKAGLLVTLGLCTGLMVHTTAVALGVATIFATSEMAFSMLKIVGASYLLYLAWQAFKTKPAEPQQHDAEHRNHFRLYRRGVIMNITNPKIAIFFLAILPQFTTAGPTPLIGQMFLLGAIFTFTALIVFGTLAWSAGYFGEWLTRSTKNQLILNRIAGTIFVALALRLVFASR